MDAGDDGLVGLLVLLASKEIFLILVLQKAKMHSRFLASLPAFLLIRSRPHGASARQ
jgi:hypothetical protein